MKLKNKTFFFFGLCYIFIVGCASTDGKNQNKVHSKAILNVRSSPNVNSKLISTVAEGTELILLDTKNDWQQVQLPDGKTGWVYQGFTEEKTFDEIEIINETYVRKGPGDHYDPFAILRKGYKFKKISEKGNWYSIVLPDGNSGWISKGDAKNVSQKTIITTSSTILREKPEDNAKEIVRIEKGKELVQLNKVSRWYYVQLTEGLRGWIPEHAVVQTIERNIVVPQEANIRRGPGLGYDIIETVSGNTRLTELERNDGWIKVRTPAGNIGWVSQEVVRTQAVTTRALTSTIQYAVPPEFIVTNQESNIRQGYSTTFNILSRVKEGTILLKIGQRDDWYRIKFPPNGEIGWIRNDLVNQNVDVGITRMECNIRQSYTTNSEVKRRVSAGTPLVNISSQDNWYRVHMPDGEIGWIRGDLASDHREILITNQACNVRQGPSTDYPEINRLSAGTIVTQSKKEGEWFRVLQPDDKPGWIREDLLVTLFDQLEADDNVNVLSGPGTSYSLVSQVQPKTKLYSLNSQGNWLEVRLADGSKGWVSSDLVSPAYPGITAGVISAELYVPTSRMSLMTIQKTNIRVGPGHTYPILQTVEAGTELIRLSQQGEWYEVRLPDGNIGYVHNSVFNRVGELQFQPQLIKAKLYSSSATRLWKWPDTTSAIVATLSGGTEVSKIDERDEWTYVSLTDNRKGWLPTNLLSTEKELKPLVTKDDVVIEYGTLKTNEKVNIRQGPSLLDRIITNVPKDYRFTKLGKYKDWYQVQINQNQLGWVSAGYVTDISMKTMITVDRTAVKKLPTDQSETIEDFPVGTVVVPLEFYEGWYAITTKSGKAGWVNEQKITEIKYPKFFASDNSKVRRTPLISDNIITTLNGGTEVQSLAEKDEWYLVKLYDGRQGWISKSVVTKQILPRIRITKTTDAYIKPSTTSEAITKLKAGDEYYPVAKQGEWYKVILRGGDYAWVYSSFYEEVVKRNILITKKSLLREGPGVEYKIVGEVKQGEDLKCLDEQNSWCQVKTTSGKIGWVSMELTRAMQFTPLITIKQTPVKTGPGDNYANIETFEANKEFTPIAESDGWFQVNLKDAKKGWVRKVDCVKKSKSRYVFTLDSSNIRSGPGPTYEVIAQVDPATDLMVIGESGEWYNVKLMTEGLVGWIKKDLVFE